MRDTIFDIMKGIGIVAMILGHCSIPSFLKSFIFTWHMPLFFIISGYFFRPITIKKSFYNNCQSLLLPYFVTALLMAVCALIYYLKGTIPFFELKNALYAVIIGAGSKSLPNYQYYFIGAIWFLQALFWCRITFSYLHTHFTAFNRILLVLLLSSISTYFASNVYIPTNILQGLSALIFYELGYQIRTKLILQSNHGHGIFLLAFISVIFSMCSGSMSMARCFYGFYPINVLGALLAFIICYFFCVSINKDPRISKLMVLIGRQSLLILCIHNIDVNYGIYNYLNSNLFHLVGDIESVILIFWRLSFAIIMAYVLSYFGFVRSLFRLN